MKNSINSKRIFSAATAIGMSIVAGSASGAVVFNDDFESGSLSNWTGKSFGAHDALIVADPLDATNNALTFNTLDAAGEIFSMQLFEFSDAPLYEVSFDYLGYAQNGSVANNFGGFVGYSQGTPGRHTWVYGTSATSGAADDLIDDGRWRTYTFEVDGATAFGGGAAGFRLMFEDFSGSGGVARDVFFDNIMVTAVPSPGAGFLAAGGLAMAARRRRRVD